MKSPTPVNELLTMPLMHINARHVTCSCERKQEQTNLGEKMVKYIQSKLTGTTGLLVFGMIAVVLVAVACGSDSEAATQPATVAEEQTTALSGTIEIDGSSTVFPITEAVAEEFNKVAPKVRVNVGVSGSGGGFKRFTRPIKEKEAAVAEENGIESLEFLVGVDGLSVLVSPKNDFVECLTVDQLHEIWKPESAVQKWSDLNPVWPDNKMNLYGPGTDSGTFDYFTEEVNGEAGLSRADYTASEDDNVLVQGIRGDRNALGYFGYSYYAENEDKLKLVAVDSGKGCVIPSVEAIADGTYSPLSRPLFIYVSKTSLERPEVREFVKFYMEHGAELTAEVGYVPLSAQEYQDNLELVSQ